jgi:imidazolonepropionase-like amidohydrolase
LKGAVVALTALLASACNERGSIAETSAPACDRSSLLVTRAAIPGLEGADSILIEDGAIAWIGASPEAPDHDRILDANGAVALAGLIDSHAHLDSLAAAKHLQAELDPATEIFPITMRQTLASGVTTVRVHLSRLDDMKLMNVLSKDDCFPSPRIIVSGPGLLGGAPDVHAPLMRGIGSPEDGAARILDLAGRGAEWAALHGLTRFAEGELEAIFDAAATSGVKLMTDSDDFDDLGRAISSPIRSGEYLNRSTVEEYPSKLMAAISIRTDEFFIVPPVGYYLRSAEFARLEMQTPDPSVYVFTDRNIAQEMAGTFLQAFEADEYIAEIIAASPTFACKFMQLRDSGATLVIGTDSGSLGQFHHDAIWKEMEAWLSLGAGPDEIIEAATGIPARMLDREDIGRLAVGMRGDVLLYRGDVLNGNFDRSSVEGVVKGGVIFVENGSWVGPDAQTMREEIVRARITRD